MNEPSRKLLKTRRRLPHWALAGATYFVTFRLQAGELSGAERRLVLEHIKQGDPNYYTLWTVVVMPDHVHLLLKPAEGYDLTRVMRGIKGVSAKSVNDNRKSRGSIWQDESYDRIMRTEEEAVGKARYILENPARAGLVEQPADYPYCFTIL